MTELKTILQIEGPVSGVLPGQIACEDAADPDVGYRMWGGQDHTGAPCKFLMKDTRAVVSEVIARNGGQLYFEARDYLFQYANGYGAGFKIAGQNVELSGNGESIALNDAGDAALATTAQTLVGAINEVHRPLNVIEVELSPNGTIPATISDLFGPGWFIVSLIKAEKISGDCSAVTVRLLDGLTEVYKHAGADGTGNDLDTEAMADRNVFSMENLSGNLTIEADSPAACVVKITLRVRVE